MLGPEVLIIVCLPGSGKTPRLRRLQMEGWEVFDDYQAKAHNDSPRFRDGRRYGELLQALRDGKKCALADMAFCRPEYREEAKGNLEKEISGTAITWEYLENNPQQCAENIRRGDRLQEPRLEKLVEFARQYSAPSGTIFLPIIRDET